MQKTQVALKFFYENVRLFGDPKTNPEKFNLYNGLAALAEAIAHLESEIYTLTRR